MSGCCGYVTGLWHCIWSWVGWGGRQPTSAGPLGSSPYLLQPKPAGTVALCSCMNQRKCEARGFKKYFYHTHACRHATKIICTQGGWATIKWNQDGGARAGKIQAFSTPPPLSKDTDGICLIRDTISFWHCSKVEPSKCGVGEHMNSMWHVISCFVHFMFAFIFIFSHYSQLIHMIVWTPKQPYLWNLLNIF